MPGVRIKGAAGISGRGAGGAVMHVSSPDVLTQEQIDWWEQQEGEKLYCSRCGKHLEPGDQKDHFWPYYTDNNLCKKCKRKVG